jgi:hypothetical protein
MAEINPYAPPQEYLSGRPECAELDIWRDGSVLVFHVNAVLPDRCVKCNVPANGLRLPRRLSWHHPAWYLLILLHLLIYIIVALCIRKTARVELGICKRHLARRRVSIGIAWAMLLGSIGAIWLGIAYDWPLIGMIGLFMILASLIFAIVISRIVVPKKIDDSFVWLKGVDREYLARFPEVES